jgi:uncharacterized membrane protein (UPF0127 family)
VGGRRQARRRARRLLGALVLVGLTAGSVLAAGCSGGGSAAGSTAAGSTAAGSTAAGSTAAGRRPLAGFAEVRIQVRSPAAVVASWCALLADDEASRATGMMGQTDLRGYDAMVFRHPQDSTSAYYMFRTVVSLSIAWFDADGRFLSAADMAPCPAGDPANCPLYRASGAYRLALEVLAGGLARLGIGPGSQLEIVPASTCPA